ncbi:MAG: acylphosphatase [Candidatus Bathyarchaeum sp.]|nr:MAG: acylphosphatase [Candidatus Bathyarchaeum sp.]
MNVRAHIFVSGKVQGVFFRVETRREAIQRNLTGWVRNTSNGKVEAIFEGEKENVDALIDFCRTGPSGARVTAIDVRWETYASEFNSFKIERNFVL